MAFPIIGVHADCFERAYTQLQILRWEIINFIQRTAIICTLVLENMQIVETQRNIRRYTKLTLISSTNCLVTLFVCVFFVMSLQPVVFSQDNSPSGAPLTIYEMELYYDDWPEARRTDSVLELVVMRDLLSLFDEEKGQIIIIRHPGGDVGKTWAFEFQGWLVSFGIPMEFIVLEPGSGYADALFLLIEQAFEPLSSQ